MNRILMIAAGFLLIAAGVYAASGDFTVNGNLGVGTTTTPRSTADVVGTLTARQIVEEQGLCDLAKGITPTITAGSLSGGGPTYVGNGSYWTTSTTGASITIDTGITSNNSTIQGVSFGTSWRTSLANTPRDYIISTSPDNVTYADKVTITGNADPAVTHYFSSNDRYVRLTINGFNSGNKANIARLQILSRRETASFGRDPWVVTSSNHIFPAITGNVGIGTTAAPGAKLEIAGGNTRLGKYIQFRDYDTDTFDGTTVGTTIISRDYATMFWQGGVVMGNYSNGSLPSQYSATGTLLTTGQTALAVNSGKVGIGMTNPAYKLDVQADAGVWKASFGGSDGYIRIGPTNSSWAHIYTDRPNFIFDKDIWSIPGGFSSYSAADLSLKTNGTTRMTIKNSTGRVGIGTTDPQNGQLHIRSTAVPLVLDESDQSGGVGYWRLATDGGGLRFDRNTVLSARTFSTYHTPFAVEASGIIRLGGFAAVNGGNETMVIGPNNGSVGIGVPYAPANFKLRVEGTAYATGIWQSSDAKFKKNSKKIDGSLDKVLQLDGVSYEFKKDEYPDNGFPDGRHYGVIAQEIEKVLPEAVKENEDGSKAVAYTEIIPVLIEAIKEQQKVIEELKQSISELQKK